MTIEQAKENVIQAARTLRLHKSKGAFRPDHLYYGNSILSALRELDAAESRVRQETYIRDLVRDETAAMAHAITNLNRIVNERPERKK
jgi:hypothetical protein